MGVTSRGFAISLGEGSTPLVAARRLSTSTGYDLHLKLEGANPTGSFKDRGMVVAVGRAAESGARAVVCASTGNTAASAATYAARAGLASIVLTPAGATATAKRAQAVAVGARLLEVRGSFDDALRICRELGERPGYVLVNSLNPDRIEGQKTVVFELLESLGSAPEIIALPFGGGGNVSAVAAGLADAGASSRIVVGQAAERATTWATAIRIAQPAHAEHVAGLVASGRVEVVTLSEEEIRAAWKQLATTEGAFCEPASAAGYAALVRLGTGNGETAVCILTGHGLKDTGALEDSLEATVVDASLEAVLAVLA
jgi:threonine synthase